ncbi:hypothetical protein ACFL1M_01435 [Patescibacteria group bacterium]
MNPESKYELSSWGETRTISSENAWLDYEPGLISNQISISQIKSNKPGEGKKIVSEFISIVGSGKKINGSVIEPDSVDKLRQSGILAEVESTQKSAEIPENITKDLKAIRLLRGGGLKVDKVVVSPIPESDEDEGVGGHRVQVYFFGET